MKSKLNKMMMIYFNFSHDLETEGYTAKQDK